VTTAPPHPNAVAMNGTPACAGTEVSDHSQGEEAGTQRFIETYRDVQGELVVALSVSAVAERADPAVGT
jgi:hypothetical protein